MDCPLEISVQETQKLLAAEAANLRLIDVRDPDEYAHCRLPNAELIPLATLPADAAAKLPDKSAQILVYCHHGMRSLRATEYLRQMGLHQRSQRGRWDRPVVARDRPDDADLLTARLTAWRGHVRRPSNAGRSER